VAYDQWPQKSAEGAKEGKMREEELAMMIE